ncbi:lysophospholipid acyltransferase family protein [Halobacillus salinus]|uniref:lysophospholipid acyltransferase family protein n=1 Tax=Halobacillus salinus TaxID=192814 RepID=UPI0009A7BBEA|nr:lysophospholipid acyltransferase family protein [Halobacillus salinus]
MKKAEKNKLIEWGFTHFNRFFLRSHFEQIHVWKDSKEIPNRRTLFLINHSTWWDPLLIFYLNDQIVQSDGYAMMSEKGMKKHPFFQKVGGYSINAELRRGMIESLQYSIQLLNEDKTVWIFPQGQEEHLEKRPLEFFSGTAYIAEHSEDVNVVPISLYYSLEHSRRPNVYVRIGEPVKNSSFSSLNRKELSNLLEDLATKQLDELREAVIQEQHNLFDQQFRRWKEQ